MSDLMVPVFAEDDYPLLFVNPRAFDLKDFENLNPEGGIIPCNPPAGMDISECFYFAQRPPSLAEYEAEDTLP